MRFLRQTLIGLFLSALALALVIYAVQSVFLAVQDRMSQEGREMPPNERVFAVNLQEARLETVVPELEVFGQVQSRRTLEIRSPVAGRVVELAASFEEGGVVEEGDMLLRIDPKDAQSALETARSNLQDAETELRDAERSLDLARDTLAAAEEQAGLQERAYQRQIDLETRGVATSATVESAELAAASSRQAVLASRLSLAQAELRIDQAKTDLSRTQLAEQDAQRDLEDTVITAEFAGTLSDVNVVEGGLVSVNEMLGNIVDGTALEVSFRVSTSQYARLLGRDGSLIKAPVRVTLDANGADLQAEGQISRDNARAGEGQLGRMLYALLDPAPGFKPDDFVIVKVDEPPLAEVALLPASALDSSNTVLVLEGADRLQSLSVELVRRQGDDVLVRGEGLAGQLVVVDRTPVLGPGIRVRPLNLPPSDDEPPSDLLELSQERRSKLVAFVEANEGMPAEMKARMLAQLSSDKVPAGLVARIESRIGG